MACGVCHRVKDRCHCKAGYLPALKPNSLRDVPLTCPFGCPVEVKVLRKDLASHGIERHGMRAS